MPSKELRPYKEIAKDLKLKDTAAALDMVCACMKNTGGRPFKYADTEEGLQSFTETAKAYFTYVQNANNKLDEKSQIIPDVEGLSLYLGIDRSTLFRYQNRGGEWAEIIDYIKNAIAYSKKQLALKGRIPTVMAIFDLTNNHSYYNTNSFTIEAKITDNKESDIVLEHQARAAGLIWNEVTKDWEPEEG